MVQTFGWFRALSRSGLLLEAADASRVLGQVGGKELERDLATQPHLGRQPHLPHPARSKRANELIGVQPRAGAEGHWGWRDYSCGRDAVAGRHCRRLTPDCLHVCVVNGSR